MYALLREIINHEVRGIRWRDTALCEIAGRESAIKVARETLRLRTRMIFQQVNSPEGLSRLDEYAMITKEQTFP